MDGHPVYLYRWLCCLLNQNWWKCNNTNGKVSFCQHNERGYKINQYLLLGLSFYIHSVIMTVWSLYELVLKLLVLQILCCSNLEVFLILSHAVRSATRLHFGTHIFQYLY
jgi:hypothetical protein